MIYVMEDITQPLKRMRLSEPNHCDRIFISKSLKRQNDIYNYTSIKKPRIEKDITHSSAILIQRCYRGWIIRRNSHLFKFLFYN
jgi:hypothetical protein